MAKGGNFERQFCKQLSLWWSGGDSDDVFWRTSNSGGRSTIRGKAGKDSRAHHGDVCAVDGYGWELTDLITWELKRGYGHVTCHALVEDPAGPAARQLADWMAKAAVTAQAAGAYGWALVHRRDRRGAVLYLPATLFLLFQRGTNCFVNLAPLAWLQTADAGQAACLRLEDFFEQVTPQHVRRLVKEV